MTTYHKQLYILILKVILDQDEEINEITFYQLKPPKWGRNLDQVSGIKTF